MCEYAARDSISLAQYAARDSVSEHEYIHMYISMVTVFVFAIVITILEFCVKDDNVRYKKWTQRQVKTVLKDDGDENKGVDNCRKDASTGMENRYQSKNESNKCLEATSAHNQSDCEDSDLMTTCHLRRKSSANGSSDMDYNTVEIHGDGLVGKLKSKRLKELEAQLTEDQLEEEKKIERDQLAAIFELLKKQEAELNMKEIDENELNAQLALYR